MCCHRFTLPLWAVLALAALPGCKKVNCPAVCERVRKCQPQVTRALVDRQPQQSTFMKSVRKQMPAKLVPRLIKSCPLRCDALRKNKKWQAKLRTCASLRGCDAFARCIAPALEP